MAEDIQGSKIYNDVVTHADVIIREQNPVAMTLNLALDDMEIEMLDAGKRGYSPALFKRGTRGRNVRIERLT